MVSVTVTDGCREGYNEIEIHNYTTVSFMKGHERGRIIQPVSSLSSICVVFCNVYKLKQAGSLKSDC
jgi:hypothetical protein